MTTLVPPLTDMTTQLLMTFQHQIVLDVLLATNIWYYLQIFLIQPLLQTELYEINAN